MHVRSRTQLVVFGCQACKCVCACSHWSLSFLKALVFDLGSSARLSAVSLPTLKGFSLPPPPAPTETSCFVPCRKLNYMQLIWNWEIRLGFAGRGMAVLGNLSCAKGEKSQPIDKESLSNAIKKSLFSFSSCKRIKLYADDIIMSKTPTWQGKFMTLLSSNKHLQATQWMQSEVGGDLMI